MRGWAGHMTEAALLTVDRLRVAYGEAVVVDDVSFAIAPGACLGIIGAALVSGLLVRRRLDRLDLVAVLKLQE